MTRHKELEKETMEKCGEASYRMPRTDIGLLLYIRRKRRRI
jgi:hypothetical protein